MLSEAEFDFMKKNLRLNPFYELEPRSETVVDKFGKEMILCGLLLGSIVLAFNLAIFSFTFIFGIVLLIRLMNEISAYASAMSIKKAYFLKMREKIIASDDYAEFVRNFY